MRLARYEGQLKASLQLNIDVLSLRIQYPPLLEHYKGTASIKEPSPPPLTLTFLHPHYSWDLLCSRVNTLYSLIICWTAARLLEQ